MGQDSAPEDRKTLIAEAEAARRQLVTAVEALPDAFAYFDAEDRLVLCNRKYREFYPLSAAAMVQGARFVDILRAGLQRGEYRDAVGREEAWLAQRLAAHRLSFNTQEQPIADGRWIRVIEQATPEGGRVGMRMDVTELKQAEQRLEDIIVGAEAGTWEWSVETGINLVNARWAEMLGLALSEVQPVTISAFYDLLHPDDHAGIAAALAPVLSGAAEQFDRKIRMRHKAGHWVSILTRGRVARRTTDGAPILMAGVHLDITALEQAEQRLDDLIRGASVGTWEVDIAAGVNVVNERWTEMVGLSAGEFGVHTIDTFRAMVHPDDLADLDLQHATALAGGRDRFENEIRLRHADGRWVWILSRGRVTRRDSAGRPLRLAGVHIDISESKDREAALKAANHRLETALADRDAAERRFFDIAAISTDWFWEQDCDGRFTYISESYQRNVGTTPDQVIGRTRLDLFRKNPDTVASADWAWLDARIAAREGFSDFVYLALPHGTAQDRVWVRISGAPFTTPDGAFAGYRGVGSDVTQLYNAKEKAEAANRAKSQFLANMSHEIRTPLNGVLGMAELLDAALTDPAHRSMVATIRQSGEGLLTILNDILDLAKVEAGKLEIEAIGFRPREVLDRIESLHLHAAQAKGLTFCALASSGADIKRLGDPHRLLQVLHNLVSNAIKFTATGEVTVTLRATPNAPLRIEVRDTGIGMTVDQVDRAFNDFEQADGAISRRFGGTGLGLSIARRLVTLMGGMVEVASVVGQGTTVTVTLPLPMMPGSGGRYHGAGGARCRGPARDPRTCRR